MSNQQNPKTLRDREFDSLISDGLCRASGQSSYATERAQTAADVNAKQERQHVANVLRGTPFEHAGAEVGAANRLLYDAAKTGDVRGLKQAHEAAHEALLRPYYKGRGAFDGARFLRDLETTRGSVLPPREVALFGALVGQWTGKQLVDEVQKEIDEARASGASFEVFNDIIARAFADATNPLNVV